MLTPLEEIKSKIDVVDYIKQTVKLAPSGKSMKGLCPFHKEKTPSFFVSPERQVWYCFGCQKGGDIFKFIEESEHVDFPEALKILADKAGIQLRYEDPRIQTMRNRAFEILKHAQIFYQQNLSANARVMDYMVSRGMKQETIETFGIGFAPAGWKNIFIHLKTKGFTPQDIEQAGLITRSQRQEQRTEYYDRFRSRVMFPIFDQIDRVVGFSGRILPQEFGGPQDQSQEAKYINTPETLVYQKGKILYGFHKAKQAIKDANAAVLVEGNMDMLMGWQDGIENIVAVSGTGLTEYQLSILKRLCATVVFDFDMDRAGEMATDRSIGLATKKGFIVKILSLPSEKDLADFVRDHPGQAQKLIPDAQDIMAYYVDTAFRQGDATTEDKKRIVAYLLPRLKLLDNPIDQQKWTQTISQKLRVREELLIEELRKTPSLLSEEAETNEPNDKKSSVLFMKSRLDLLAERALGLMIKIPYANKTVFEACSFFPYRFQEFVRLLGSIPEGDLQQGVFPQPLGQESLNYLALRADYELAMLPDNTTPEKELELTLFELKREKVHSSLREITLALKEAEAAKNVERVNELMKQAHTLTSTLAEIENSV